MPNSTREVRINRIADRVEAAVIARFEANAPTGLPTRKDTLPTDGEVEEAVNREFDKLNVRQSDRRRVLREFEARYGRAS